jgi:hypothetical protein
VVVALFLNILLKWYRRPILTIEFENKEPFCRHTLQTDKSIAYFLRLQVKNTGKSMARDCEGKLVKILDVYPRYERPDFDPTNLHWAGHGTNNAISIHKKAYEYLDIIHVRNDVPDIFLKTNEVEPRGFSLAFPRQDYILDIVLYGKNTEPVEKFYKIHIEANFAVGYDKVSLQETKP